MTGIVSPINTYKRDINKILNRKRFRLDISSFLFKNKKHIRQIIVKFSKDPSLKSKDPLKKLKGLLKTLINALKLEFVNPSVVSFSSGKL